MIAGIAVRGTLAIIMSAVPVSVAGGAARPLAPVLLITIDTLRADHLGCYGYFRETSPNIDRLAGEGTLFETVVTTMSTTLPAHTSLMTSSYPVRHGVLSNMTTFQQPVITNRKFRTAAQMFKQAGYRTAAFVSSGAVLGPETGIDIGFDSFDAPPIRDKNRTTALRDAKQTGTLVIDWLKKQSDGGYFLWVHFWDPHDPYKPPPEYERLFKTDDLLKNHVLETGVANRYRPSALEANNLYDGEIRYTDHWIGELLRTLRERAVYDASLIVLTSDHGEGLMQHSEMHHGRTYNEAIDIPLVVKFPAGHGKPARRIDQLVSLIDVLPMITEELDLPFDREQFDGLNPLKRHDRRYVIAERARSRRREGTEVNLVLRDRQWKYFYFKLGKDALYDLESDYREINNVIDRHPEIARAMKQELLRLVGNYRERGSDLDAHEDLSPEMLEQLKSLGYVD